MCDRCIGKIEQFFDWRTNSIQTDNVFRSYAESMRAVTSTINFQDGTVNIEKMTPSQKHSYLDSHMAVQQHINQATHSNQSSQQNQHGQQSQSTQSSQQSQNSQNSMQSQQSHVSHRQIIKDTHVELLQHHPTNQTTTIVAVPSQQYVSNIKVPQIITTSVPSTTNNNSNESAFNADDGLSFDGSARVLQSISW